MKNQSPKVTPTLHITDKARKTLSVREAAYLAETTQDKILDWGTLGEFEIRQPAGRRRYVDYPTLMAFLGEPVEAEACAK
jgi:hypothetical protein